MEALADERAAEADRQHAQRLLESKRRTGTRCIREMVRKGLDDNGSDYCWGDETKRPYGSEYKTKSPFHVPSDKQPPPSVYVRAVHPVYPDIEPSRSEVWTAGVGDPMAGFTGEVALPKQTEVPGRYTSVFHHDPANSAPYYSYPTVNRQIPEQHP
ncbi:hypothetical protein NKR19_g5516 [Coniochaeta hoffmannii]|uniref:Uncharacterized protein n=1 Tax=Coniochaeta hoffmannii TaxID=91930 RepID=A0AA38RWI5_9PEZI|nr:hypothetical protein NKR19_g5516 [Coniochaeta hoffmannii]